VVGGIGLDEVLKRPEAFQSNLPASTMMPPRVVPWPPMNLVAELSTMSAPHSMGLNQRGEAEVLSTISGRPFSCAMAASFRCRRRPAWDAQRLGVERAGFWIDGGAQAGEVVRSTKRTLIPCLGSV